MKSLEFNGTLKKFLDLDWIFRRSPHLPFSSVDSRRAPYFTRYCNVAKLTVTIYTHTCVRCVVCSTRSRESREQNSLSKSYATLLREQNLDRPLIIFLVRRLAETKTESMGSNNRERGTKSQRQNGDGNGGSRFCLFSSFTCFFFLYFFYGGSMKPVSSCFFLFSRSSS